MRIVELSFRWGMCATVPDPIRAILKLRRHNLPLPPGSLRLPIVGSAFNLPKEREWLVYDQCLLVHGMSLNSKIILNRLIWS